MESSRTIPQNRHAEYSFMTFDQRMAPIPGRDPLEYRHDSVSGGFTSEPSFFGSNSFSESVQDMSKHTYLDRDSYPTTITIDEAEAKNDPLTYHITRPRNAFMIYRSECLAQNKISREVEHDSRHISRIIGHCWQKLSKEEKAVWKQKADDEKAEHKNRYPDYKFSPVPRSKKPLKRTGKRNGEKEMERCRQVADLLLSGKQGQDLAVAIKRLDLENADNQQASATVQRTTEDDFPAFINPLRRPTVPSAEVNTSSSVSYEPRKCSPQHYYPSPPLSPASSKFMFSENPSQHPYSMNSAFTPSHGPFTGIYTRKDSPGGPYHANGQFSHSTTSNNLHGHHSEAHAAYLANKDPFLDAREYNPLQRLTPF